MSHAQSAPSAAHASDYVPGLGLNREQVEVFADGLHHIATLDGVHRGELALIREFLSEAGCSDYEASLGERPFEVERALRAFDTSFVRRLFLKACILMVRADHVVTDEERELLDFLADAFGLSEQLSALESEVQGDRLHA